MRINNVTRLRVMLAVFVTALAVPAWMLINHAVGQLKWEAYYNARQATRAIANTIDQRLAALVRHELDRAPADYSFLLAADRGNGLALAQRSELSRLPAELASIPGLVGHFQVGADGQLTAPALPTTDAGQAVVGDELAKRKAIKSTIETILAQNLLIEPSQPVQVGAGYREGNAASNELRADLEEAEADQDRFNRSPKGSSASQSEFDRIASPSRQRVAAQKQEGYGRVADLKLESRFEDELAKANLDDAPEPAAAAPAAVLRAPEAKDRLAALGQVGQDLRVTAFENQVGAFRFSLLDSGHFVLFRNVWRDGERQVQGALIDQKQFLDQAVGRPMQEAETRLPAQLLVAYGGNVLGNFSATGATPSTRYATPFGGELLYQTRLSPPLSDLELIFLAGDLPLGSGLNILLWLGGAIALVLCAGSLLIYRLGLQQLKLARQQRDFVSAVSHELKTPLTSIRMYGEMLTQGLAADERKPEYYRFIFDESERLSRLIDNVLQLARLDRNELELATQTVTVGEILDLVRSKVASQVASANFEFLMDAGTVGDTTVCVDPDAIVQIFINLIDNAIKFSRNSDTRKIELTASSEGRRVVFALRDHGPGIARDQISKVFKLFYRSESELTRETVGTGIGLALVQQLVAGMDGSIDVRQCEPGTEFRLSFQAV